MNTEDEMPDWAQDVFEGIASQVEFKGPAEMEARYFEPGATSWGVSLLEIAPAVLDLSRLGGKEGEVGYGLIHAFDLLAAQEALDEVAGLAFGLENDGRPMLTMEGKAQGHEIVVLIHAEPFDEPDVAELD